MRASSKVSGLAYPGTPNMPRRRRALKSSEDTVFTVVLISVMSVIGFAMIFPFLNVLALSFNDAIDSVKGGIYLFPRNFTTENYRRIFEEKQLLTAMRNSLLRTGVGTAVGVFCASMMAFTLSRRDFVARKLFSVMFAITMYVQGGLIPTYLLMRSLGLFNSFMVYILPGLLGAWNVFVIRSFMDTLPECLQESAKLDGANDFTIFIKIVLPLSIPVLATVSLFIAVNQWNAWFDTYLYNSNEPALTTLQYELQKMLSYVNVQFSGTEDLATFEDRMRSMTVTPESLRMAMTIFVTFPILLVYPLLQRYFVSGLTLGAIKS